MKKVKMALMAFAAMSSIGSAFAFSPVKKAGATTYYAVKTGSGFHWTTVQPTGMSCQTATNGICSITTSKVPTDNQVPAGHSSDDRLYQPD